MPTIQEILTAKKAEAAGGQPAEAIAKQRAAEAVAKLTTPRDATRRQSPPPPVEMIRTTEAAEIILAHTREDRATPEDVAAVTEWMTDNLPSTVDHITGKASIPLAALHALAADAVAFASRVIRSRERREAETVGKRVFDIAAAMGTDVDGLLARFGGGEPATVESKQPSRKAQ